MEKAYVELTAKPRSGKEQLALTRRSHCPVAKSAVGQHAGAPPPPDRGIGSGDSALRPQRSLPPMAPAAETAGASVVAGEGLRADVVQASGRVSWGGRESNRQRPAGGATERGLRRAESPGRAFTDSLQGGGDQAEARPPTRAESRPSWHLRLVWRHQPSCDPDKVIGGR